MVRGFGLAGTISCERACPPRRQDDNRVISTADEFFCDGIGIPIHVRVVCHWRVSSLASVPCPERHWRAKTHASGTRIFNDTLLLICGAALVAQPLCPDRFTSITRRLVGLLAASSPTCQFRVEAPLVQTLHADILEV